MLDAWALPLQIPMTKDIGASMREVLHNLLYGVQLDNFTPLTVSYLLFCIVRFNVFVIVRNTIEFKFL
jgi:hypothetical protein